MTFNPKGDAKTGENHVEFSTDRQREMASELGQTVFSNFSSLCMITEDHANLLQTVLGDHFSLINRPDSDIDVIDFWGVDGSVLHLDLYGKLNKVSFQFPYELQRHDSMPKNGDLRTATVYDFRFVNSPTAIDGELDKPIVAYKYVQCYQNGNWYSMGRAVIEEEDSHILEIELDVEENLAIQARDKIVTLCDTALAASVQIQNAQDSKNPFEPAE